MSADPTLEQLREIPEYLTHESAQVREQALTILKGFSVEEDHLVFLRSIEIIKPIVRGLSDRVTVALASQVLLVNLSVDEVLREQMIQHGIVDTIMELLITCAKQKKSSRLLLMILNNITLSVNGCNHVMQEGKPYMGLHAMRLMQWFNDPLLLKRDGTSGTDDWAKAGLTLSNLSQLESFRRLICEPSREVINKLKLHLINRQLKPNDVYFKERAIYALRIYHNLSFDADKHYMLLNPKHDVLSSILSPLIAYNDNVLEVSDLQPMPKEVQRLFSSPLQKYSDDNETRRICLDILLLLCRNTPSRRYLRAVNVYYILRELHNHEREIGNEEHDVLIDDELIHFFILDEDHPEDQAENEMTKALDVLERQAQGLLNEDDVDDEYNPNSVQNYDDTQDRAYIESSTEAAALQAIAEKDDNSEIVAASRYNEERKRMNEAEERRLEQVMLKNQQKYADKFNDDQYDKVLNFLD